jgi:hypothetical protein
MCCLSVLSVYATCLRFSPLLSFRVTCLCSFLSAYATYFCYLPVQPACMSCLLYLSVLPSYVDYLFCLLVLLLVRLHVLFTYMLSACAACLRNQPMNSAYATCLY